MTETKEPEEFLSLVQHMIKNKDETHVDIIELNDGTALWRYTGPVLGQDGQNMEGSGLFMILPTIREIEETPCRGKEQLSITLRSIGDGVITTNIKGEILTINKAAVELTGWKLRRRLESHYGKYSTLSKKTPANPQSVPCQES